MTGARKHSEHGFADILYDAIYIAGLGGGIVAVFFLFYDVAVHGDFFYTPSLIGTVLFEHVPAEAVHGVSMWAVAKFTPIHIAGFSVFGLVLSWITQQVETASRHPALVIGVVFVVLELLLWVGTSVLVPGVLERIGVVPVAIANLLAATGIGMFLVSSHRRDLGERFKRMTQPGRAHRA